MKLSLILLAVLGLNFTTDAAVDRAGKTLAPTSRDEYCQKIQDPDYIKSLAYNSLNHNVNENDGGLGNNGVCWWHSMLQRNSLYLAVFKPELPKPSKYEARTMINDLITEIGVVEIPGFNNFSEFTNEFRDEIQSALDIWQITDGAILFGWLRGITGDSEVKPDVLKKMMDDTYKSIKEKNIIAYQMLQEPGVNAHSWLVVEMNPTAEGYEMKVIDSKYPKEVRTATYKYGMTQLPYYKKFVPYTSRNFLSNQAYKNAQYQYCVQGETASDIRERKSRYN